MIGERERGFYEKLSEVRNVRLSDPLLRGSEILKGASLSFTISGTVAIESLVMNIPSIIFSKYYSSNLLIHRSKNIKHLNKLVAAVLKTNAPKDYGRAYLYARYLVSRPGRVPVYENAYDDFLADTENINMLIDSFSDKFANRDGNKSI